MDTQNFTNARCPKTATLPAGRSWLLTTSSQRLFTPGIPTSIRERTCSGLPILRSTHDELVAEFSVYRLLSTSGEDHVTPWGTAQRFIAVLLQRNV